MPMLENLTFDEITVGQAASYTRTVTEDDLLLFAAVSGDVNPVHLDEAFAAGTQFKGRIAHGMYTGGLISAAIAMTLPGPGTIYLGQDLRFERPVRIGDTITVQLTVLENIEVPLYYRGHITAEDRQRCRELADLVGLGKRLGHRPTQQRTQRKASRRAAGKQFGPQYAKTA